MHPPCDKFVPKFDLAEQRINELRGVCGSGKRRKWLNKIDFRLRPVCLRTRWSGDRVPPGAPMRLIYREDTFSPLWAASARLPGTREVRTCGAIHNDSRHQSSSAGPCGSSCDLPRRPDAESDAQPEWLSLNRKNRVL